MATDLPTLVDGDQLATILGVCKRTVDEMRRAREIPAYRIRRVYRYSVTEVLDLLRDRAPKRRKRKADRKIESIPTGDILAVVD